jgi:hypothetical protein
MGNMVMFRTDSMAIISSSKLRTIIIILQTIIEDRDPITTAGSTLTKRIRCALFVVRLGISSIIVGISRNIVTTAKRTGTQPHVALIR